jgi:hypothetical protein
MGRPLHKDVNGVIVTGTFGTNVASDKRAGIRVQYYDGSLKDDGVIVKQRGAKTFVVARVGSLATRFTCVLQSAEPSAAGQMRMQGSTTGTLDTGLIPIAKITKRVATAFNDVRYRWFLENDSSADYIVLIAI